MERYGVTVYKFWTFDIFSPSYFCTITLFAISQVIAIFCH